MGNNGQNCAYHMQFYDNHIHITQPSAKYMYLIATLSQYGYQAYGHVTLTMSA